MKRPELLAGERKPSETDRAVQACNDYLRMGAGRSLRKLLQKYGKTRRNTTPTDSFDTLANWSSSFEWQLRAAAYDAETEAAKNEKRRQVMEQGLALDFERVTKLKRLARFLEGQIFASSQEDDGTDASGTEYPNVWLKDVKQIGSGEDAERVDLVRFNASILAEYRAALADLAAETGGRKQKVDHLIANIDYSRLSDHQLQRIAAGEDPIQVIISGYSGPGQGKS